jgi:hypothetical protein
MMYIAIALCLPRQSSNDAHSNLSTDWGSDSVYPASSSSSMRIGFSGDPSPNDVVKFSCLSLLLLSFSTVGWSKAGDRRELDGSERLIEKRLGQRVT